MKTKAPSCGRLSGYPKVAVALLLQPVQPLFVCDLFHRSQVWRPGLPRGGLGYLQFPPLQTLPSFSGFGFGLGAGSGLFGLSAGAAFFLAMVFC